MNKKIIESIFSYEGKKKAKYYSQNPKVNLKDYVNKRQYRIQN